MRCFHKKTIELFYLADRDTYKQSCKCDVTTVQGSYHRQRVAKWMRTTGFLYFVINWNDIDNFTQLAIKNLMFVLGLLNWYLKMGTWLEAWTCTLAGNRSDLMFSFVFGLKPFVSNTFSQSCFKGISVFLCLADIVLPVVYIKYESHTA